MPGVASIQIVVDDSQVDKGFAGIDTKLASMGARGAAAGSQAAAGLGQVAGAGNALANSLIQIGGGFGVVERSASGAENQIHRAHDATALFSNLLGVGLPRELEKFISKSQTLGPLFSSLFDAAVITGFVAAIGREVSAGIELWESYANAVVEAQRATAKAAGDEETSILEGTLSKNRDLQLKRRAHSRTNS